MLPSSQLQSSTLISNCNTLISSLYSLLPKNRIQDSDLDPTFDPTATLLQAYIQVFDSLDSVFTQSITQGVSLQVLEEIQPIPVDSLVTLLDDIFHSSEDHEDIKSELKKDLTILLMRIAKCTKNYGHFKVLFPSNMTLKFLNVVFQTWKLIPSDQLAIENIINITGVFFGKNKEYVEIYTETLFTFIQELVLDTKSKNAKQQYGLVLNLILNILKNLSLQELDATNLGGCKMFVIRTLEQNAQNITVFMDKVIEFLLEKYENSKHSGFKQLLKIVCEEIFQHITDYNLPLSSVLGLSFLEKFVPILRATQYTLSHRIFYAELSLYFVKKNLEVFYKESQKLQSISTFIVNNKIESYKDIPITENPKACSVCFASNKNPTQENLCSQCYFIAQHLSNCKKNKDLITQTLTSTGSMHKLLDSQSLFSSLLKYKKGICNPKTPSLLFSFTCETGKMADLLKDDEVFNEVVLESSQNEAYAQKEDQIPPSLYKTLYVLNILSNFSQVISSFRELYMVFSNESSTTLRTRSIDFLNEVAKISPEAVTNDEELMKVLQHRIYDSSSHLRLTTLEVILILLRKNFDTQAPTFHLVLERCNDISPAIRKTVVTFMLEVLVHSDNFEHTPNVQSLFFTTFAKKVFDKEEISTTCFSALLHVMFSSFSPKNAALKKLLPKKAKKTSKSKGQISENNQQFEQILQLLKTSFEILGQEWYYKMLSEASKIGTLDSNEIVQFIGFLLGKVHKSQESKSFLFGLLKPFSENFAAEFVPEVTYFQVYLSEYNKRVNNSNIEERREVKQVCEILQNIITNYHDTFTPNQLKKILAIEQELLQIVYKDTQTLISAAMKTICLSIKHLTSNYQMINEVFLRCYSLFVSHFQASYSYLNEANSESQSDENSQNSQNFNIKQSLPTLIRSSYIIAYIIKFLGMQDLSGCLSMYCVSEIELVNTLYDKFCWFARKSHGIVELNQAGVECVVTLWDYNPILALKSRDIIQQFLGPAPENKIAQNMQLQILSLFHNILQEYRQDNQKFLQRLEESFKQKAPNFKKGSTTTPRKTMGGMEQENACLGSAVKKPANQNSVIQLISECMDLVIPRIYESAPEIKTLIVRVVLLMMQEGRCHLHTVFPKIFALVGEDNEEIRAICLDIIDTAMIKNATIVSFELENSILEALSFEEKYKKASSLFIENSEQQKISSYEIIYENSLRYAQDKETTLRTCVDALCTLIHTVGNKTNSMKFICEFLCALPRIKVEHFSKASSALRTFIERNYHKVIQLLKPLIESFKDNNKKRRSVAKSEREDEQKDQMEEEKSLKGTIEKNQDLIFSLFTALLYSNFLVKATKEATSGRHILSSFNEPSITILMGNIQTKASDMDKSSFVKTEFSYENLMSIKESLNQYFEVNNYQYTQNVYDLYKTIKGLYKGKVGHMEVFESLKIYTEAENVNKPEAKKKKVVKKVEATPKKLKIKVVMKRNTTITKKSNKFFDDDEKTRLWEDEDATFKANLNEKPVFNTEYKVKLRKRRVMDLKDPFPQEA